jgi:hypothetical protein
MPIYQLPTRSGFDAEVGYDAAWPGFYFQYFEPGAQIPDVASEPGQCMTLHELVTATYGEIAWEQVPRKIMRELADAPGPRAGEVARLIARSVA